MIGYRVSKQVLELEIVDSNVKSKFLEYSCGQIELFKMLLSKYMPLYNEDIRNYEYIIKKTLMSNETAEELERKLKISIEAPAHPSGRLNQLLSSIVQDLEFRLSSNMKFGLIQT